MHKLTYNGHTISLAKCTTKAKILICGCITIKRLTGVCLQTKQVRKCARCFYIIGNLEIYKNAQKYFC